MCTPGCTFWPPLHTLQHLPSPPTITLSLALLSSPPSSDSTSFMAAHLHPRRGQQASPGRLGWGSQETPSRRRVCQAPSSQTRHVPSNPPPPFFSVVLPQSNLYPNPDLTPTLILKFRINLTLTFQDKAGGPEILALKSHPGTTMREKPWKLQIHKDMRDYCHICFFFSINTQAALKVKVYLTTFTVFDVNAVQTQI